MRLHYLFLWIFIFSNWQLYAQEKINELDANGKKTGLWIKKYQSGITEYEASFKNGIPDGIFKRYLENGKLSSILVFSDKGNISRGNLFHENGKVMANGKYINHLKDSIWNFYAENGELLKKANYSKNEYHGWVINFYKSGSVKDSISYKNGVLNGDNKEFYENGNLKASRKYIDGNPDGAFKLYYENKVYRVVGKYKNGKKEGNWKYYSPTLKVEKEESYEDGGLIYSSEEIISYWNDSLKNIRSKEKYEKSGRSLFYAYHPNGQLAREGYYFKNQKDSVWQYFNEKGILESIQTFYLGTKNGHWTFYHPNGKVHQEYSWFKDKMDGEFKEFYPSEKLKIKGLYNAGKQVGMWYIYHENGEIKESKNYDAP